MNQGPIEGFGYTVDIFYYMSKGYTQTCSHYNKARQVNELKLFVNCDEIQKIISCIFSDTIDLTF